MTPIALHPNTKKQFDQFAHSPTHAILVTGTDGIGKLAVARHLAAQIVGINFNKLDTYQYFYLVQPEKQSIGIDSIREVGHFLQNKTIGTGIIRRAVIVEDAHLMTIEAQNAFLKSLEEPPLDTLLILTASQPQLLLHTITSRVQTLNVHVPPRSALEDSFKDNPGFNRAYRLSGGLPGLTCALLADDQSHPLYQAVTQAKELLQAPAFKRLTLIDAISKDKQQASHILDALERIAQTGLEQAATKQQEQAIKRWQRLLEVLIDTRHSSDKNANTKLAFTHLLLQI
jgi:DNA polymerase-3 subunit delta'